MNIIILSLISSSIQYTLVYNLDSPSNSDAQSWYCDVCKFEYTTCNTNYIFGGYQKNFTSNYIHNLIANLRPHYKIKVEMLMARLGNWNNNYFFVAIDGNRLNFKTKLISSSSTIQCNSLYYDEELFTQAILHRESSIAISIINQYSSYFDWVIGELGNLIYILPGCEYCKDAASTLTNLIFINKDGWQGGKQSQPINYLFRVNFLQLYPNWISFKTFILENLQFIKVQFQHYTCCQSTIKIDSVFSQVLQKHGDFWELYESKLIPHSQLFLNIYFKSNCYGMKKMMIIAQNRRKLFLESTRIITRLFIRYESYLSLI